MKPIRAPGGHHHWLAIAVPIALSTLTCCGSDDRFELTMRTRDAVGSAGAATGRDGAYLAPWCVPGNQSARRDESLPSDTRTCVLDFGGAQWRAEDGRRAINQFDDGLRFLSPPEDGDVVCGGQPVVHQYSFDPGPELRAASFELTLDGGDTLRLEVATGVWASASTSYSGLKCFEANGRWRGAAGELQDRTGRFTILYDSVQTVLQLVED